MNIILIALLAAAAPAHAFFWSCPALLHDDSVSNLTVTRNMLNTMFPAKVYLKKGEEGEKMYSCITVSKFDTYQAPPTVTPGSRSILCFLFGCSAQDLAPKPYNATIKYFMNGVEKTAYCNISITEKNGGLVVNLIGVPYQMFGQRNGEANLQVASIRDDYVVLIDCDNYFMSLGHTRYAYMLISSKANLAEVRAMDWRCVASGLEAATETSGILPAGICST